MKTTPAEEIADSKLWRWQGTGFICTVSLQREAGVYRSGRKMQAKEASLASGEEFSHPFIFISA